MYVVLANESLYQLDLVDLKFLGQVKGWACNVGKYVYNFLLDGEEIHLSDSVCRSGTDHQIRSFATGPVDFKNQNITCPRGNCFCGFDLGIPKGRTASDLAKLKLKFNQLSLPEQKNLPVFPGSAEVVAFGLDQFLSEKMIHIEWYLGKRCNYDCSYCSPTIHDNVSLTPSQALLFEAYEFLLRTVDKSRGLQGKVVDFIFHGGEPTLVPGYIELVEAIRADSRFTCQVQTLTNLTRNAEYLYRLNRSSDITYSVHLEYFAEPSLERLQKFLRLRDSSSRDLSVKVMYLKMHSAWIPRILECLEKYPGIHYSINPLHNKKDKLLYTYDDADRAFFRQAGRTGGEGVS